MRTSTALPGPRREVSGSPRGGRRVEGAAPPDPFEPPAMVAADLVRDQLPAPAFDRVQRTPDGVEPFVHQILR